MIVSRKEYQGLIQTIEEHKRELEVSYKAESTLVKKVLDYEQEIAYLESQLNELLECEADELVDAQIARYVGKLKEIDEV